MGGWKRTKGRVSQGVITLREPRSTITGRTQSTPHVGPVAPVLTPERDHGAPSSTTELVEMQKRLNREPLPLPNLGMILGSVSGGGRDTESIAVLTYPL